MLKKNRPGFTIIELVVTAAIIGLLATLIIINTTETRAKSRDANRRQAVDSFSAALEQRFAGEKTYFVKPVGTGKTCTAALTNPDNHNYDREAADMFMTGTGNDCVGYKGGGAGRINATNPPGSWYKSISIAQTLLNDGFLAKSVTDPTVTNDTSQVLSGRDYLLVLCDKYGYPPTKASEAVNYAVYASLERPDSSSSNTSDMQKAYHACGGDQSYSTDGLNLSTKINKNISGL